ncbi:MAG: biotin/lipoyl-binding protein, partial [Proteobacteria bacterium]
MSEKAYTPANGAAYEMRRAPNGDLLVRKENEKTETRVALQVDKSVIDAQTTRLHRTGDKSRGLFWVYARGNKRVLSWPGGSLELDAADLGEGAGAAGGALKPLKLTMPGKVLEVKVKEGDLVELGQGLLIVEAMKMENLLLSPGKARIGKVHVKTG